MWGVPLSRFGIGRPATPEAEPPWPERLARIGSDISADVDVLEAALKRAEAEADRPPKGLSTATRKSIEAQLAARERTTVTASQPTPRRGPR